MTSATDIGLPVNAAIDATMRWVNGADPAVFRSVDGVLGPADLPLVSTYKAPHADRERVRGWLTAVAKAVERKRARGKGKPIEPRASPAVRREVWAELQPLTGAFSYAPILTTKGIEYELVPNGFIKSTPLTWAALATAELMTDPERFHFFRCSGCDGFSVDVRDGQGKRRGRYCSRTCQNRVGQRNKRMKDKAADKAATAKVKLKAKR